MTSLVLNKFIRCEYSKELSEEDSSFEHPKDMLQLMDKKISAPLLFDIWKVY